jgi:radical SAM superfamily enzyme
VAGYGKLRAASNRIGICVHLIFGLPDEDEATMLRSVREVAALQPDQVKLHLLHVLHSSRLGEIYERGEYQPMERESYIDVVTKALTLLPPETVIARLTGDGMAEDLLAPEWSRKKVSVINDIDKRMYELDLWQGKYFKER